MCGESHAKVDNNRFYSIGYDFDGFACYLFDVAMQSRFIRGSPAVLAYGRISIVSYGFSS